jgi:predicted PhzF superfamily epimerase YddE/YHI9
MQTRWFRLRVGAGLPGRQGGIARVALLAEPPADAAALTAAAGGETCCLIWRDAAGQLQARCLQRGAPIRFCGHGLLAGAWVWWRQHGTAPRFDAGGFALDGEIEDGRLWLHAPRPTCEPEALDAVPAGWFDMPPQRAARAGPADGYRVLEWPAGTDLRALRPDLAAIAGHDGRALIATAAGNDEGEVTLRYFAPQYGNTEDPATGSACVVLVDYWARRRGWSALRLCQRSAAGALFHGRVTTRSAAIAAELMLTGWL